MKSNCFTPLRLQVRNLKEEKFFIIFPFQISLLKFYFSGFSFSLQTKTKTWKVKSHFSLLSFHFSGFSFSLQTKTKTWKVRSYFSLLRFTFHFSGFSMTQQLGLVLTHVVHNMLRNCSLSCNIWNHEGLSQKLYYFIRAASKANLIPILRLIIFMANHMYRIKKSILYRCW